MKHISISTLFVMLAVPFVVIGGGMLFKDRTPPHVPSCYKERICDTASVLAPDATEKLRQYQDKLLDQYDIDMRVVTGPMSPSDTLQVFNGAKIGKKSKSKRGALLLIDTENNLARFQATPGLDKVYTNEFVSYIERDQMAPFFPENKVADGIIITTGLILSRAQEATEKKEFDPTEMPPPKEMARSIGTAPPREATPPVVMPPVAPKPASPLEAVVLEYHKTLLLRNAASDLSLFSEGTKASFKQIPRTIPQIDAAWRIYKDCRVYKNNVLTNGLGVVLFDITQRQCAPYFLVQENGVWKLDLATRNNHIHYNARNEWYLDMKKPLLYADGLLDWSFNKDGLPLPMKKMRWGLLVQTDHEAHVTYIKKVYDNTPASINLPFQVLDVILEWDGMASPSAEKVIENMNKAAAGQKIHVLFWRNGQKLSSDIQAPPALD